MVEPPDTAAKVDELMALAERRLGRSRGALRRVADDEVDLAIRVGTSVADLLDDHVQEFAGLRRDYRAWFCEERIGPLQEGFDAVDLVLEVGQYLSAKVMRAVSPTDRSPRLESLIELHALSVLVSNETIDLLRGGWPAAAEARWRTLHEAEVIALFLTKAPQSVSRRYLDSFATDMHRLLRRRLVRLPPGRAATTLRRQFAERSERAATEHGVAMTHPYGWAARWLRKKRVTFADLEKRVALGARPMSQQATESTPAGWAPSTPCSKGRTT
ncbi:MAG TPA: DUF5677 domain-containing protein [Candidatus Limnocylindria bacterium]